MTTSESGRRPKRSEDEIIKNMAGTARRYAAKAFGASMQRRADALLKWAEDGEAIAAGECPVEGE